MCPSGMQVWMPFLWPISRTHCSVHSSPVCHASPSSLCGSTAKGIQVSPDLRTWDNRNKRMRCLPKSNCNMCYNSFQDPSKLHPRIKQFVFASPAMQAVANASWLTSSGFAATLPESGRGRGRGPRSTRGSRWHGGCNIAFHILNAFYRSMR